MSKFYGTEADFERWSYVLSEDSRLLAWVMKVIKKHQTLALSENDCLCTPFGGIVRRHGKHINMNLFRHFTNGELLYELVLTKEWKNRYFPRVNRYVTSVVFNSSGIPKDPKEFDAFYQEARKVLSGFPLYAVTIKRDYIRNVQVYFGPEPGENGPDLMSKDWTNVDDMELCVGMFRGLGPDTAIGAASQRIGYERWMLNAYPAK